MSRSEERLDLAQVAADDDLLGALGAGMAIALRSGTGDGFEGLLARWQGELDDAVTDGVAFPEEASPQPVREIRPSRRRAATIGAVGLAAVLAMTGTAAAVSGVHGPLGVLHRALFGGTEHRHSPDLLAARTQTLLDQVAVIIDSAHRTGGIADRQRTLALGELADADTLLRQDPTASDTLGQRAGSLRAELAGLPSLPLPVPTSARRTPFPAGRPAPSHGPESVRLPAASTSSEPPDGDKRDSSPITLPTTEPEGENPPASPPPGPDSGKTQDSQQPAADGGQQASDSRGGSGNQSSAPNGDSGGSSGGN